MSKTIWKFELHNDKAEIEMPNGAQILSVQNQERVICLWAIVTPEATVTKRTFEIFGTGNQFPDTGRRTFIGTVQVGVYVWHVFEKLV